MSLTITLQAWWLLVYLLVGVALYVPLSFAATRQLAKPHESTWWYFKRQLRSTKGMNVVAPIGLWPIAAWEVLS